MTSASTITGVPTREELEFILADIIREAQMALDVAHEGTSRLTPARATRAAAVTAVLGVNSVLVRLQEYSPATLAPHHRLLMEAWREGAVRMTDGVRRYEDDPSDATAAPLARAIVDWITISHRLLSARTPHEERKSLLSNYLGV